MTPQQEKKILQELINEGYSTEESKKILQGHKEIKESKGISAEEMKENLEDVIEIMNIQESIKYSYSGLQYDKESFSLAEVGLESFVNA